MIVYYCSVCHTNNFKVSLISLTRLSHLQRFVNFCEGKLKSSPWSELDGLQPETTIIDDQLVKINSKGFLTINSQPAVNAEKSDSPSVGTSNLWMLGLFLFIECRSYCCMLVLLGAWQQGFGRDHILRHK
jgi:hypothetical protein